MRSTGTDANGTATRSPWRPSSDASTGWSTTPQDDGDDSRLWRGWSPVGATTPPIRIARGAGYHVWDADGQRYVDGVASALNAICGYGHPRLVAAMTAQAERLHHFELMSGVHAPATRLADRLSRLFGGELTRTVFVNSGSEAIEAAVRIAVDHWASRGSGRRRVVTLAAGYHGSTALCQSLSGLPHMRNEYADPLPVTRIPLPGPPSALDEPGAAQALLAAFEEAVTGHPDGPPAAVLVEPVLNVGGGSPLPAGFLTGLRELCDRTGTLFIADEVFTGFGRTGRMFGFQHDGAVPDIVATSKGLAGGYVPIGAVTTTAAVVEAFRAEPVLGGLRYGHTTSGHAVACATALAVLDVLEDERLVQRAAEMGARLVDGFRAFGGDPAVRHARGRGLVAALELHGPAEAEAMVRAAARHGALLRAQGAAVMAMPPLTIDAAGVDALLDAIRHGLAETAPASVGVERTPA